MTQDIRTKIEETLLEIKREYGVVIERLGIDWVDTYSTGAEDYQMIRVDMQSKVIKLK